MARLLIPHRIVAATALAASLTGIAVPARAQHATLERSVKAAFLYKFAGYASWPDSLFRSPDTPVRIGITGDEELANELRRMVATRTSGGRRVEVVSIPSEEIPRGVHIAFRADGPEQAVTDWITEARKEPILIVTETSGALNRGSMINFVDRDGRVRFEVGLGAAKSVGITLSSRLLSVAFAVETRSP
jgi:hypothetical protein